MKCSACEPRLGAYLDGELDARESGEIEAHLKGCAACQASAADLRAVEVRLEGLRGIEPRQDFTLSVMSAIAAMPAPKPVLVRVRWFIAYLASAWALLLGLTVARVINWQHAFAATATEFGKAGAAGSALIDVAGRLHVPAFAAAAFGVEAIVIVAGALALRHYLPRLSGWIAGAQTI